MTRKTLFRHILALQMLHGGMLEVWYWLMPAKCKRRLRFVWQNPRQAATYFLFQEYALAQLKSIFATRLTRGTGFMRLSNYQRVGDTVSVRLPHRFTQETGQAL